MLIPQRSLRDKKTSRRDAVSRFETEKEPGLSARGHATQWLQEPGLRWTPLRKAMLVESVRRGELSLKDACERHGLSVEEYRSWERAIYVTGAGLRLGDIQRCRRSNLRTVEG